MDKQERYLWLAAKAEKLGRDADDPEISAMCGEIARSWLELARSRQPPPDDPLQ